MLSAEAVDGEGATFRISKQLHLRTSRYKNIIFVSDDGYLSSAPIFSQKIIVSLVFQPPDPSVNIPPKRPIHF